MTDLIIHLDSHMDKINLEFQSNLKFHLEPLRLRMNSFDTVTVLF